jgi:hypothetical protein
VNEDLKIIADIIAQNLGANREMVARILDQNAQALHKLTEFIDHARVCKVCQAEKVLSDQEKRP